MNTLRTAALSVGFALIAGLASNVQAQAQSPAEHEGHHPEGSASVPARSPEPATRSAMGDMDRHMQKMQAMHEKMMAAKTPEQRQALMSEHMKLMREGMAMMKGMRGGMGMGMGMGNDGKGTAGMKNGGSVEDRHRMMEKRMDMMEGMMQMMMDRMPPADSPR